MTMTLTFIPAGAVSGGLLAADMSGTGDGPFILGSAIVDGNAGARTAFVNAAGQLAVETSDFDNPTSVLTRPGNATGYLAADLVANSTTSVTVPTITVARSSAGAFRVSGLRLHTNKTSGMDLIGLRVRLWSTAPTYGGSVHDNDAYAVATGSAGYLGKVDFILEQFTDGAVAISAPAEVAEILGKLASGTTIAWDIQTLNAFTPASGQTFTLTAFLERK